MKKREAFSQPRFVLAEGVEDAAVIRALIDKRNLRPFDVSPTIDLGAQQGNTAFENAISVCEPLTGFLGVSEVVLISDNDSDPAASFAAISAQVGRARQSGALNRGWGSPQAPTVKAAGDPSLSVWMWPSEGGVGCLETLLWQVVSRRYPAEAQCVEDACVCSGAINWSVSKLDKARIRCFISLKCRKNPAATLATLWRDHPELIPLDEFEFDRVADFLNGI